MRETSRNCKRLHDAFFPFTPPHRQAHTDTHTDQERSTVSEFAFLLNCYKSMFIVYGSCSGATREGATLLPVPPGQPWAGRGRHQGRWAAAHGITPALPATSVHGQNKVWIVSESCNGHNPSESWKELNSKWEILYDFTEIYQIWMGKFHKFHVHQSQLSSHTSMHLRTEIV